MCNGGGQALDEGITFIVCGLQMKLHGLERVRWTLLVLHFDFHGRRASK